MRVGFVAIMAAWAATTGGAKAYRVGDYVGLGRLANGNQLVAYVQEGSYLDTESATVQNSTLVTERRTATVAVEAQIGMVQNQIAARLGDRPMSQASYSLLPQSGGNAGAGDHRGAVWASAGYNNIRESNINSFGGWNANLWSFALGYDYKFNDKVLAGLAVTYSNLNGDTKYQKGNIRDNAYGFAPYVAFRVTPCFDIDLMAGYSRVNKKRDRRTAARTVQLIAPDTINALANLDGPVTSSSPKSDRYFAAIFANYKHHVDRWNLLGRLGYMFLTDNQKAFNETNVGQLRPTNYASQRVSVNRLSLRLQAGYRATTAVEPYAFLIYARDFSATKIKNIQEDSTNAAKASLTSPNRRRGNDTYGGGLGLHTHLAPNWTGGLEASYTRSTKKFQNVGAMANIKWLF